MVKTKNLAPWLFFLFWLPTLAIGKDSCVVLMYHHFSNTTPKSTSISPQLFSQQLQYLKDNNFNVLKLSTVIEHLKNRTLPPKCVALTTDDGYSSIYKNAYPLLKQYQMPMAVFVSTEAVDKNFKAMMSWQQMREIQGEWIQFYNHSVSHTHLPELSIAAVEDEINSAQARLEHQLGVKQRLFAYPYGEYTEAIYQRLKELDYIAFGQHSGALGYYTDTALIPRFPMAAHYAKMASFITKVNTLAFDINHQTPISPLVHANEIPYLMLEFVNDMTRTQQKLFNCFDGSGESIAKKWLSDKRVVVMGKKPIKTRRSRYNCTMPSTKKEHYYWYSHQWLNAAIAE